MARASARSRLIASITRRLDVCQGRHAGGKLLHRLDDHVAVARLHGGGDAAQRKREDGLLEPGIPLDARNGSPRATVASRTSNPSVFASAAKSLAPTSALLTSWALVRAALSTPLSGELVLDPCGDVLQGRRAAFLDVQHLDRVKAERRANGRGRDLSLLQCEGGLLELRHQIARAHETQIATLRGIGGILGHLPGELREILARLGALDDGLNLGLRLVLRVAAPDRRHPHEHMRHVDAAGLLELGPVLLVVRLDVLVRDRLGDHRGIRPSGGHRCIDEDILQAPSLRPRELRLVGLHVGLEVTVRPPSHPPAAAGRRATPTRRGPARCATGRPRGARRRTPSPRP